MNPQDGRIYEIEKEADTVIAKELGDILIENECQQAVTSLNRLKRRFWAKLVKQGMSQRKALQEVIRE